ncbi:hypothetical protein G7K_1687-t1 [Saitoella complicata NRRL Y-17804]|uniref:Zn(2)-C6 fungal-type domain-containing protein n=2 Tax=Saitoella complicata (strain BCRC 22490 / CBS 7301 / JCM 7358 / NBRC 10748 / NRRL Y-17804) TaxID=698492 RepID=A0A0E9NCQ8_SAICN|nr:hypothetical protein G7K_1687-t1 [Saitoella complicata NRRL Y-17804]
MLVPPFDVGGGCTRARHNPPHRAAFSMCDVLQTAFKRKRPVSRHHHQHQTRPRPRSTHIYRPDQIVTKGHLDTSTSPDLVTIPNTPNGWGPQQQHRNHGGLEIQSKPSTEDIARMEDSPEDGQPWKIIKVGHGGVGRIAQACDRCRNKKIKCDGKRPSCTQCENVGFECRTSDKLSRRAFPRGYTESLEQRVRELEKDLRDVKNQLHAKDETMQGLVRTGSIAEGAPGSVVGDGAFVEGGAGGNLGGVGTEDDETYYIVGEVNRLILNDEDEGCYMGSSSGRYFIEILRKKLLELRSFDLKVEDALLLSADIIVANNAPVVHLPPPSSSAIARRNSFHDGLPVLPPRAFADQLVQSYFQNWQPLFPLLHKPTFFKTYEALYARGAPCTDPCWLAHLYLVFAISSHDLAVETGENPDDHAKYYQQSLTYIHQIEHRPALDSVQALTLACLYLFTQHDATTLWRYKNAAVSTALQLGLHRDPKRFGLNPLAREMRKRTFWSVFVMETFCSALLGLPKALRVKDIETELPADIDDEYVGETSFYHMPGSSTRISAALALARLARVLSNVIENLYGQSHQPHSKLRALDGELEAWRKGLIPSLQFPLNPMEATGSRPGMHSRAAFLGLGYHYTRTLIHRPVISGRNSNSVSSPPIINGGLNPTAIQKAQQQEDPWEQACLNIVLESSRSVVALLDRLAENRSPFTFCLSQGYVLWTNGMMLLYGALTYGEGPIMDETRQHIEKCLNRLRRLHATSTNAKKRSELLEKAAGAVFAVPRNQQAAYAVPPQQPALPTAALAGLQPYPQIAPTAVGQHPQSILPTPAQLANFVPFQSNKSIAIAASRGSTRPNTRPGSPKAGFAHLTQTELDFIDWPSSRNSPTSRLAYDDSDLEAFLASIENGQEPLFGTAPAVVQNQQNAHQGPNPAQLGMALDGAAFPSAPVVNQAPTGVPNWDPVVVDGAPTASTLMGAPAPRQSSHMSTVQSSHMGTVRPRDDDDDPPSSPDVIWDGGGPRPGKRIRHEEHNGPQVNGQVSGQVNGQVNGKTGEAMWGVEMQVSQ